MKSSVPVHTFSQTISDIQKSSISYHIVLVLTESDILQTREIYNISDTQLAPYLANFARYISASPDSRDYIESDLKNDTVHTEKSMILYIGDARNTKITFLFLAKDTENDDNISAFFRKQKTDLCIVSSTLHTASMYKNILLSVYTYDTYLSKKTKHTYEFYFAIPSPNTNEMKHTQRLIESVYMARDMVNMPPGDCTPIDMVGMIQSLEWKNTKIKIIPKKELETLGCNLLLAVSAGSDKDPYIVVFERISSPASPNVHAFIGKGVTFDAGGLQIKPDDAMLDMKCDMSGAAAVIGTFWYMDMFGLPNNLIGAIGLTENMTGDAAYKPLDIYKSYNGTTVEIHHTDAEGRLVLADVMGYIADVYMVEKITTMATLTGACIYGLGYDYAGIMGDDRDTIHTLQAYSQTATEKVWELPLTDKMKKSLKTDIADLKNISKSEKAGSSVGGAFLSYFKGKAKLSHIDIAGPAYRNEPLGYMPKGGTGWGIESMIHVLMNTTDKQ